MKLWNTQTKLDDIEQLIEHLEVLKEKITDIQDNRRWILDGVDKEEREDLEEQIRDAMDDIESTIFEMDLDSDLIKWIKKYQ